MGVTDFHGGALYFLQNYEQRISQCIDKQDPLHSATFLSLPPWATVYLGQWDTHELFTISSAPPAVGP